MPVLIAQGKVTTAVPLEDLAKPSDLAFYSGRVVDDPEAGRGPSVPVPTGTISQPVSQPVFGGMDLPAAWSKGGRRNGFAHRVVRSEDGAATA